MTQLATLMAFPGRVASRRLSPVCSTSSNPDAGRHGWSSRSLGLIAAAVVLTVCCDPAMAQAAAGGTGSLTSFLNNIVNLLTGTVGQAIAIIAVAAVGIAWALGQASPRFALGTVVGVAILFSAAWIVGQISGGA